MSNELAVVQAKASVMYYDDQTKKWIPAGESQNQGISKVQIFQHKINSTFRIVARKIQDHEVVLNCAITRGLKYYQATATFHQWRDQKQIYGLNFASSDDAQSFAAVLLRALEIVSAAGPGQMPPGTPQQGPGLTRQVSQSNAQPMQTQIYAQTSMNGQLPPHNNSVPTFRNGHLNDDMSQYGHMNGSEEMLMVTHDQLLLQQQQQNALRKSNQQQQQHQRRASQGSSGGSSTHSAGQYAQNGNIPPAPPMMMMASPQRAQSSQSNNIPKPPPPPPVTSAPPPPPPGPPPPPSALQSGTSSNQGGFAALLQNAKLRKTSMPASTVNSTTGVNHEPHASASARPSTGGADLMSEMAATLARRRAIADGETNNDTNKSTSKQEKPWEKKSGTAAQNIRRMPSGSSLSSAEENPQPLSVAPQGPPSRALNGLTATNQPISAEQLQEWRQEILNDVRKEIDQAKRDIVDAIRQEIANLHH